ncbi:uncharacterized protein [Littorina saxatilis]|uniref:uncharacterized protein isoform X2 n=1 Tax=Littorina saxatilis TaxID=31220 RepID=UPI0038B4877A
MDSITTLSDNNNNTTGTTSIMATREGKHSALLSWGCGEFGQHCQGHSNDASFRESKVQQFSSGASLGVISHISCGASHTVAITESGEVYVWGNGNSGQLGCGDQQPRWQPTAMTLSIPKGSRVRTCACGSRHTMLLLDNGHVYSVGNNFYAQLGYNFREKNYKENQIRPQFLEFLRHRQVRQVACGDKHSVFLFDQGAVAVVGNNAHGQIGDGSRGESAVPKAVDMEQTVIYITCGPNHNLAITDEGDVYAWGYGKACGKRRHDVLSPELISFKGKQIVQVAGGSTHSLALTAGGKVYAWGFGIDGQLGLGSIVMATKPRQLRHSFLEEGASSVACGDAFSAVITVSGRLYMWGKNSHTIQEGMGSLHKVVEPHCMNPEPSCAVRHVVCGAWHAVALTGLPDFVPSVDESDSESSDEETVSNISRLSSAQSREQANREGSDRDSELLNAHDLEISAPPQATTPRGPSAGPRPPLTLPPVFKDQRPTVSANREKTKITIGEFYASSESMSNSVKSSSAPTSVRKQPPPKSSKPPSPKSSAHSKVVPLVVEVPSVPVDSESEHGEPLPVSTREEMMLEDEAVSHDTHKNPASNTLVLPSAMRNVTSGSTTGLISSAQSRFSRSEAPSELWPSNTQKALQDTNAKEEGGEAGAHIIPRVGRGGGGVGGRTGSIGGSSLLGPRSRTSFIGNTNPTVQVSRNPPKNFTVQREKSVVVGKSMDILDASQLLASGAPAKGDPRPSLGRPYGTEGPGMGYFSDTFGYPINFDDFDGYDFDYLEASPRLFGKDMEMQHVPTHHLDGDFGARQEQVTSAPRSGNKVSRSRSALSSRDLAWIDQLLLQKVVSKGPTQVKRSTSFFGALSGQVSRSPTKFFRKPTPSGVLSRTTTPASHTPAPHSSLAMASTFGGKAGGGRGRESRLSTRGLGMMVRNGVGGNQVSPQRGSQAMAGSKRSGGGGYPSNQNPGPLSTKAPVFSSAASWRMRPNLPHDFLDESKIQSAPTSSQGGGRTHVWFADQRSSSVTGKPEQPTLAGAVAAPGKLASLAANTVESPSVQDGQATFNSHGEGHGKSQPQGQGDGSLRQGEGQKKGQKRPVPVISVLGDESNNTNASNVTPNTRQAPTLSYKTLNGNVKNSSAAKNSQPSSNSKSSGIRTMLSGRKHTSLTSLAGQGRSRTELVVSGSIGRNRKAHFD